MINILVVYQITDGGEKYLRDRFLQIDQGLPDTAFLDAVNNELNKIEGGVKTIVNIINMDQINHKSIEKEDTKQTENTVTSQPIEPPPASTTQTETPAPEITITGVKNDTEIIAI